MSTLRANPPISAHPSKVFAVLATPAMAIFLTSNLVNVGNMSFNLLFSRWMGPELFGDLTVLLTIKLALLGILGAFQSSVSQQLASVGAREVPQIKRTLAQLNKTALTVGLLVVPLIGVGLYSGNVADILDLKSQILLPMLLATLPIAASLSVLRGVALGQMIVSKVVLSSLIEMGVRLFGAMIAWHLGLGLTGVVLAVALSIVAGWIVLTDLLPSPKVRRATVEGLAKSIGLAALPFGLLYFAQVLALDGDIFLAKVLLPSKDAGFVAALLLFQRIQFFACFALASVLLPQVVKAARSGDGLISSIVPFLALFLISTIVFLTAVRLFPEALMTLLVGPDYLEAAQGLMLAAVAAVAFTLSFLIATFLAALGNRNGIWATLIVAIGQVLFMALFTDGSSVTFITILGIKCTAQVALTLGLIFYAGSQLLKVRPGHAAKTQI